MKKAFTFALGLIRESFSRFRNPMVISFSVINYVVSMRFPAGCGEPYLFYVTPETETAAPFTGHGGWIEVFLFKSGIV